MHSGRNLEKWVEIWKLIALASAASNPAGSASVVSASAASASAASAVGVVLVGGWGPDVQLDPMYYKCT